MEKKILILKNYNAYKCWKMIKKGKKIVNQKMGAGYYITLGIWNHNPIGEKQEWKMKSGKTALVELIDYTAYEDPDDMVKESYWHQRGYKGEKLFKNMSFSEYLKSVKPN